MKKIEIKLKNISKTEVKRISVGLSVATLRK
jgi:hypothetical protein